VSGGYPNGYVYRLTRIGSGTAKAVISGEVFFPAVTDRNTTPIFWCARNSIGLQNISGQGYSEQFDNVVAWYERAIDFLRPVGQPFVLIGESNRNDEYAGSTVTVAGSALNGDQSYALIVALENEFRQKWPRNFVNQRGAVVASYDSSNSQDVIDHARDVPPSTKRADFLHYLTPGYNIVGDVVGDLILAMGY
jgi:hypothetical protein